MKPARTLIPAVRWPERKSESKRRMFFTAAFLLLLALCVPRLNSQTISDKDIQEQFEAKLKNMVVAIRHFYSGENLKYDSGGALISGGKSGPWTINAYFEPEKIKVSKKSIAITGKRLYWSYNDSENKPVLLRIPDNTKIEISRSSEQKSSSEILALIPEIFLRNDELLEDFVPPYWRKIIQANFNAGQVRQEFASAASVDRQKHITPPSLKSRPAPEYTREARRIRLKGTVVLMGVIDENGRVNVTDIKKPLGAGLDDNAVGIVEEMWEFSPATIDGAPIPYPVRIDVFFGGLR